VIRRIAIPQILRDFADFVDAKMAHQIARLVRLGRSGWAQVEGVSKFTIRALAEHSPA
jgi:hypothetical protein